MPLLSVGGGQTYERPRPNRKVGRNVCLARSRSDPSLPKAKSVLIFLAGHSRAFPRLRWLETSLGRNAADFAAAERKKLCRLESTCGSDADLRRRRLMKSVHQASLGQQCLIMSCHSRVALRSRYPRLGQPCALPFIPKEILHTFPLRSLPSPIAKQSSRALSCPLCVRIILLI